MSKEKMSKSYKKIVEDIIQTHNKQLSSEKKNYKIEWLNEYLEYYISIQEKYYLPIELQTKVDQVVKLIEDVLIKELEN